MKHVYSADLASIQDAAYGDFARGAAPGLLDLLGRDGITSGTVVDLGCGAGIWLRALQRAGYTAHGIEASPALARIARRAVPGATVRVGSLYEVAFPPCVAITALGEVLCYLPEKGRAPSLRTLCRRAARALLPRGRLVFDVLVEGRATLTRRFWRAGPGWALLADVREDAARGRLVRDLTTFRRTSTGYRRGHERHVLRVFSRGEVEAALRGAGFSVRATRRYGSFPLAPRRLAFLARLR